MPTSNLGPLIAILSSSVLSFTAGQYLPYVIAAISGSGEIAAVPLAIFAVSTVVALVSVAYLVKLAVSKADNKKEELVRKSLESELIGEEPRQLNNRQCTTPEKSDKHTSSQPSLLTFGTAIPQKPLTGAPLPPPPLPQGAVPPPPSVSATPNSGNGGHAGLLSSIRNAGGEPQKKRQNGSGSSGSSTKTEDKQSGFVGELRAKQENSAKNETSEERAIRIEKEVEESRKQKEKERKKNLDVASILARRIAIEFSDSESEHSSSDSNSGWPTDEDKQGKTGQKKKLTKHRKKSISSTPQSGEEEGTETPERGYRSSDDKKPSDNVGGQQGGGELKENSARQLIRQKRHFIEYQL